MSFITDIINYIVHVMQNMGYFGIGLGMLLESACIPIPSEVILPLGGYLVSQNIITFWGAVLATSIGGTIGSIIAYSIGYFGGRPFIIKYGKFFFINKKEFNIADKWFQKHGQKAAFIGRFLPIVRTFISLPAGIARIDFKKFILLTFVGSLFWCIVFTYAGYELGHNWESLKQYTHWFTYLVAAVILCFIIFYLYNHFKKNKKITK